MPHIQQLSPHVADLIAAGEVVERPASVVKELVENAIDAGASAVTVEIQNGGMSSIRVTDNGCGIAPEELPTAFLRHATSKLHSAQDLAAIGTLGFRGEALAAIAAVSRLDVFSRTKGAVAGAALSLEGGVPGAVESAGCPEGTTMVVRELFYNTPARLKFMKKDSAEGAAVAAVVQQAALSRPEVSIRFLRDGKEELFTPGDGQLLSAIYAARGRDFALHLTEVRGGGEGIAVRGYVTEPLAGRGSRAMQAFFCCGRAIKSPLLTAALEEAYLNRQLKGKFPGCVLHIDLPLHLVDVNVHPAKTVVKFADERAVFSTVHHVVADALDAAGDLPGQLSLDREAPAPWRFVGEVLHTYIVAEDGDDVWLIDKHAAHERMNFDRMKAQAEPVMGQQLLAPVVLELSREQCAALLEQLPLLEQFGFQAEDFGGGSLAVRAIPSDIETGQIRETLEELADKLLTGGSADPAAARDALLHTMACKAAIKGGWHSDEAELRALLEKVQSGQIQYCPHGRPVKVKLTRYEIEKMFKRA